MPDQLPLEPIPQPGVADYHCHCDYSMDAVGTIDEYCMAAIARNLAEICFTTHFDMPLDKDKTAEEQGCAVRINGELKPTTVDIIEPYIEEVQAAHEKFFAMGLSVKVGVEFGYFSNCEETVIKLKEKYDLDYLLCGIHMVGGIFIEHCMDKFSAEEMAEKYFTDVITAAKSGLFDTIAHLDYYRKVGYDFYGEKIEALHKPYLNDVFAALKESGTVLELNTRAAKFGLSEYYPRMEIVNLARREGLMRYLGSDAHAPQEVGFEFENAANIVPPFIVDNCG